MVINLIACEGVGGTTQTNNWDWCSGEVEADGVVHLHYSGLVSWQASLLAQAQCSMQAHHWPSDQHSCHVALTLHGPGVRNVVLHDNYRYMLQMSKHYK